MVVIGMPFDPPQRLSAYRFEKAATWRERLGKDTYNAVQRGLLNHSMAKLFGENWRKREARENLVLEPPIKRFIDAHFETHLKNIGKRMEEGRMLGGELLAEDAAFKRALTESAPEGIKYAKEIADLTRLLVEKKNLMTPAHRARVNYMLGKLYEAKQPEGYETAYKQLAEELKHRESAERSSSVLPSKERQKWEKFLGKDVFDSLAAHTRTKLLGPASAKGELNETQKKNMANTLRGFLEMVERDITNQELSTEHVAPISDAKLREQLDAYVSGQKAGTKTGGRAASRKASPETGREKTREESLKEIEEKLAEERRKREEAERKTSEAEQKAEEAEKKRKESEGKYASKPTIYKIPVVTGQGGGAGGAGGGEEWWKKNVVAWGAILAAVIIILLFLSSVLK